MIMAEQPTILAGNFFWRLKVAFEINLFFHFDYFWFDIFILIEKKIQNTLSIGTW